MNDSAYLAIDLNASVDTVSNMHEMTQTLTQHPTYFPELRELI